tara:strand:- start:1441 stop:1899 length:459 start_codon:yes stop_codon:yes gene_type:complete
MQSIAVQYLPATKHRGTRLKAKCAGGSITVPLDYSIDDRDYLVERTVALALIAKMGWGQDVRITGAGRDYRGDVVFTLGNIETDNTSKRDRWIDQVRQSDIPTEYHDLLTYWYNKTQQYADATPIEYMRRHLEGSYDDAVALRKMLNGGDES